MLFVKLVYFLSGVTLQEVSDAPFYSDEDKAEDSSSDSEDEEEEDSAEESKAGRKKKKRKKKPYVMDPDHRLLLRNCKPLLQSRSAAVCYYSNPCRFTYLLCYVLLIVL